MTACEPIRVLIADDHPLYRDGLELLLDAADRFTVVASATDGAEAVAMAAMHQPDVVVMDLQLPCLDGIEATRQIVAASPHVAVLVLTMFEDDTSVFAAIRAGRRGYLVKGANRKAIRRAVDAVASGETILSPAVAVHLLVTRIVSSQKLGRRSRSGRELHRQRRRWRQRWDDERPSS